MRARGVAMKRNGDRVAPQVGVGAQLALFEATSVPRPPAGVISRGRPWPGARLVPLAQLVPDSAQPRTTFDGDRLRELARSILDHGLLQPLIVTRHGTTPEGEARYLILAGGRRHAALHLALTIAEDTTVRRRLAVVPVVIRGTSDAERRVLQLAENLHREALAPLDEARALREIKLLEGLSNAALARRIRKSAGYVDERLRLLRHPEISEAVAIGRLNRSTGAALASLGDAGERRGWMARLAAGEQILARDIYASKRRRTPVGLKSDDPSPTSPNFGDDSRPTLREAPPEPALRLATPGAMPAAHDAGGLSPEAAAHFLRRVVARRLRQLVPHAADPAVRGHIIALHDLIGQWLARGEE